MLVEARIVIFTVLIMGRFKVVNYNNLDAGLYEFTVLDATIVKILSML